MQRDDAKLIRLLKTAGGQIDGIIKMIEEKKYCIDVSNQIMAAQAILSRVNKEVLNQQRGAQRAPSLLRAGIHRERGRHSKGGRDLRRAGQIDKVKNGRRGVRFSFERFAHFLATPMTAASPPAIVPMQVR